MQRAVGVEREFWSKYWKSRANSCFQRHAARHRTPEGDRRRRRQPQRGPAGLLGHVLALTTHLADLEARAAGRERNEPTAAVRLQRKPRDVAALVRRVGNLSPLWR